MLDEVFVKKAAREAISKYKAENGGKKGVYKADVIQIVMLHYGGDMSDVHNVMEECVKKIAPDLLHSRITVS